MHFFKKVWGEDSVGKIEKWFIFSINESTRIDWGGGNLSSLWNFPFRKTRGNCFSLYIFKNYITNKLHMVVSELFKWILIQARD